MARRRSHHDTADNQKVSAGSRGVAGAILAGQRGESR